MRNAGSNPVSILDSASRVLGSTINYPTATPQVNGDAQSEYIGQVDHDRRVAYGHVSHTSRYYIEDSASIIDAGRFVESGISLGPGQQKTTAFLVYIEDRYQIIKLILTAFAATHGWDKDLYGLEVELNPKDGGLKGTVLKRGGAYTGDVNALPMVAPSQAARYINGNTVQSDLIYEVSQASVTDRAAASAGGHGAVPAAAAASAIGARATATPPAVSPMGTVVPAAVTPPKGSGIQKGAQVQVNIPESV